jgi:hypothetical protein
MNKSAGSVVCGLMEQRCLHVCQHGSLGFPSGAYTRNWINEGFYQAIGSREISPDVNCKLRVSEGFTVSSNCEGFQSPAEDRKVL